MSEATLQSGEGTAPSILLPSKDLELGLEEELASGAIHAGAGAGKQAGLLHQQFRAGLVLIALIASFWTGIVALWMMMHGVNLLNTFNLTPADLEVIARFNFLGVTPESPKPSILSLNLEIVIWSTFGVVIHTVLLITRDLRRGQFATVEALVRAVSDLITGVSLALVVLLLLRVVRLDLGGADMTLANADYETIAVLAFVLGFYHEDALRLLGRVRGRFLGSQLLAEPDEPAAPKSA